MESSMIHHGLSEPMNQSSNESLNQEINDSAIQSVIESMNQWINGAMNQWFNESVSQETNEWITEAPSQWILPASFLQKCSDPLIFAMFKKHANRALSLQSGAHFADLISQKCSEHIIFFDILKCKLSSRSFALLVDNFARSSPATAETETLLRRSQEPHYPQKMQGFAPESVFTREFTRFWTVIYTSQLCDDGWLTWWCGQHDGVNAKHDHRP